MPNLSQVSLGACAFNDAFFPLNIAGLSLWLKADAGVTLSGTNVTAWADQSGNERNATVIGSPVFNASDRNGNPTISLSTISGTPRLFSLASNPMGASGSTAFSVQFTESVCNGSSNNGAIFGNFGESSTGTHFPYHDCFVYDAFATTIRKGGTTSPATLANTFSLYSVKSTNNSFKSFVNQLSMVSTATNTYSNSIGGNGTLYIGRQTAGGTYNYYGKIAEVLVYNSFLSDNDQATVEAYLKNKYAL
jgi:hypothetical protein